MAANVIYTGDPQVGQKARVFTLPLSPTMSQCFASPLSFTPVRGKVRWDPKANTVKKMGACVALAGIRPTSETEGMLSIEQGLKLDLRSLRRQGLFRPNGALCWVNLRWSNTYTGEETASAGFSYCAGSGENWLRLKYTVTRYDGEQIDVNETFQLVRHPQPFGGYRWYIICPSTRRRCQCLYLPPGASHFRSRRGFGVRLQYFSQTQAKPSRLMETGRSIARRVLMAGPAKWREEYRDWDFPPKPPWMRWKT